MIILNDYIGLMFFFVFLFFNKTLRPLILFFVSLHKILILKDVINLLLDRPA